MVKNRLVVTSYSTVLGLKYTRGFSHHKGFQVAEEYNKYCTQVWVGLNGSILKAGIILSGTKDIVLFPLRKTDFFFNWKLVFKLTSYPCDAIFFFWLILECEITEMLVNRYRDSWQNRCWARHSLWIIWHHHQTTVVGLSPYVLS